MSRSSDNSRQAVKLVLKNHRILLLCFVVFFFFFTFLLYTHLTDQPSSRPSNGPQLSKHVATTAQDLRLFNETLSHILVPRVSGTEGNVKVGDYIVQYMSKLDWHIDIHSFTNNTPMGVKPFRNIIATFNPEPCKRLVVACHYDSKYFRNFEFLGASDSAVPCTMMLEMARLLHGPLKQSMPKDMGLQFMFFDGEEAFVQWSNSDSLYGSRKLVQKLRNEAPKSKSCGSNVRSEFDRIDLFMLLDLMGEKDAIFCNHYPQARRHFVRLQAIETELRSARLLEGRHARRSYFPNSCPINGPIEDDHVPFDRAGLRNILHLIALPFPRGWHNKLDNAKMIHHPTVNNLMKIFRAFLIEHFRLKV